MQLATETSSSYNWDFGDGSGIVSTATKTISHNFASPGVYNVKLLATDVSGCFDSTKTVITVKVLPITGTASPASGCIPSTVSLNANVTTPVNSSVTNYLWNFGDGSPMLQHATKNRAHVYASVGSYTPSVTITTSEGCTNTFSFGGVAFGTPPFNEIAYPEKTVICGSDSACWFRKLPMQIVTGGILVMAKLQP